MKSAAEMRKIAEEGKRQKENSFLERIAIEIETAARWGKNFKDYYGYEVMGFTEYVIDKLKENGYNIEIVDDELVGERVGITW